MRNWQLWAAMCVALAGLRSAAAQPAAPAQPVAPTPPAATAPSTSTRPALADDVRGAAADLTDQQKAIVDEFLKSQAQRMLEAAIMKDGKAVVAVREAVLREFRAGTGAGFRRYFMASLAGDAFLTPMLASNWLLVQCNAALVVTGIDDPAMVPALAVMLRHANPAVRLYAAAGLKTLRPLVVQAGGEPLTAYCTALRDAGATESDPLVLRSIVQALDFSPAGPLASVNAPTLATAQAMARDALVAAVPGASNADGQPVHLLGVRRSDPGICRGMTGAVPVLAAAAGWSNDIQARSRVLKVLADLMANAGQAVLAPAGGSPALPPEELKDLLRTIEVALAGITKAQGTVAREVSGTWSPDSATKVVLAINAWVGTPQDRGVLTADPWNVRPPTAVPLGTTPRPATRAATP